MFYTYIIENPQGRFYIGHTHDLQRRLAEHNAPDRPKTKYSAKHGPWELVWSEPHPSRSQAMQREMQIKAMKSSHWIRKNLLNG